jgi:MoaA/NifB/PqqE/SkfB family radical SAM enzyme
MLELGRTLFRMSKLTLDILGDCNLDCGFCYQDLGDVVLSEEDIFEAIDDNPHAGTIEIGGGEPFLDSRIVSLTKKIRERGRKVHISTNATIIPEGFLEMDESVREGVGVQVSLHAPNPQVYELVHGKNLFYDVLKNIHKLKPAFRTSITSAVYQDNVDFVPALINLAGKLDLPIRFNLVFPIGRGNNVRMLNPRQVDMFRGYLLGQKVLKGDKVDSPLIHGNNCYALEGLYGVPRVGPCPVDAGKIYISPDGKKRSCEFYDCTSRIDKLGEDKNG